LFGILQVVLLEAGVSFSFLGLCGGIFALVFCGVGGLDCGADLLLGERLPRWSGKKWSKGWYYL
jgi:hypothetical protein